MGSYESFKVEQLQAVLNRAKELDITFEEFIHLPVFLLSFDSKSKKIETISLFQLIKKNDSAFLEKVILVINEIYELDQLARFILVKNSKKIKTRLNEGEHKDVLDGINTTKSQGVQNDNTAEEVQSGTSSVPGVANTKDNVKDEKITLTHAKVESKLFSPTSKAIVAGAICSVIAGLAVGGGLFAVGVALPMLALIGIAVAAALVTGLVAGGITYEMSKPSSELKNSANTQQTVSSTQGVSV